MFFSSPTGHNLLILMSDISLGANILQTHTKDKTQRHTAADDAIGKVVYMSVVIPKTNCQFDEAPRKLNKQTKCSGK